MTTLTLLGAGVLTCGVGVGHSLIGERWLLGPLLAPRRRQGILESAEARRTFRFSWHLTTIAWWGIGLTLAALAFSPRGVDRATLTIIAATFLLTAAVICAGSRGRHVAWPVCVVIAGLTAWPVWMAQ